MKYPARAKGEKIGVVFGFGFGEASNYDEDEDNDMDYGGDIVEAGGAFRAEDGEEADDDEHDDGDRVELAVVCCEAVDLDEELVGGLVAESGEVGCP